MTSVTNPITRLRAPKVISTEIISHELKPIAPDIDARIANTLIKCQADALTPITVKAIENSLKQLARQANLLNPEDVKIKISTAMNTKTNRPATPETKNRLLYAYDKFCKYNEIQWKKPYYKVEEKAPLIPTTESVNAIINNASERFITPFTILSEIGCSPQELANVTQNDINRQTGEITIRGTKGHASKAYKLKAHTAEMLNQYLAKYSYEHPFPPSAGLRQVWIDVRKRTAEKLHNPELLKVQCRNLRNYSGAQYYLRLPIRDPIKVMWHLRHKKLETTMHYLRAIVLDEDEEYESRFTDPLDKPTIKDLLEHGWNFVQELKDGTLVYRKHK